MESNPQSVLRLAYDDRFMYTVIGYLDQLSIVFAHSGIYLNGFWRCMLGRYLPSTTTGCHLRIAPPRVPPGFRLYGIYRREAIGFNLLDLTVSV